MPDFIVTDFGAVGDGQTNDAPALQKALDACHQRGGGRVVLPAPHIFLSGPLHLSAFVELHLERGATLKASSNLDDYVMGGAFHELHGGKGAAWISAHEAHYCAITGGGTLDAQGKQFMLEEGRYIWKPKSLRPHAILITKSNHLTFRDFTLKDSANWALHPAGCEDVVIHGIRILNDLKVPNCDGIDPDHCRNVRISDCHIECGDDCIVIKNRKEFPDYGPTENITVTGCTMVSTSAALKIGTESVDDFRDIIFDACVIRKSHRGLAIQIRDNGNVDNVIFSNCIVETRQFEQTWWGLAEPIYVTAFPRTPETKLGTVRNVRFQNILCRGENGVLLMAPDPRFLQDIQFDGVRVEIAKTTKWPVDKLDIRPPDSVGLSDRTVSGFVLENARRVGLRDCEVVFQGELPDYYRHALEAKGIEDLRVEGFRGQAAHPCWPAQKVG